MSQSDGDDILGVRVTITLSSTLSVISGDGTKDNPYVVEDKNDYFGGYVKLGDDVWRVYDSDDEKVKLVLTDYAKEKGSYSNSTYRHNDTVRGSIAYYLNNSYLDSLSYKDLVVSSQYYNGFYSDENNYDISSLFENPIETKVGLISIGDVIFPLLKEESFTSTGTFDNSTSVYLFQKDGSLMARRVSSEAYVIPCITILKDKLTKGTGLESDPYRTE